LNKTRRNEITLDNPMKTKILTLFAVLLCANAFAQQRIAAPFTPMLPLYLGQGGTIGLATSGTDSHGNAILGVAILSGSAGGGGSGGAVTVTSGTVSLGPSIAPVVTGTFGGGQVLKSGSCNLYRVTAAYLGSTTAYLQLFNASSVPSDGAIPTSGSNSLITVSILAPGTNTIDVPFGVPASCPYGVTAVMSSTCQVGGTNYKTALTGTVANYSIQAQ
jgi:hypothetical protein